MCFDENKPHSGNISPKLSHKNDVIIPRDIPSKSLDKRIQNDLTDPLTVNYIIEKF